MANKIKKTTSQESRCELFRVVNGNPSQNMKKLIELMGGINTLIGQDDIVIIKPNVQWWNQGAPNLAAVKRFVELIFDYPTGFKGEVIIAENCHRGANPWKSSRSGWLPEFQRNANLDGISNFTELTQYLKNEFGDQFSVSHWIDVDSGGKRVYRPLEGEGYVYCDGTNGVPLIKFDNGLTGGEYRETIMTYPIFKTNKDTIVDFKNGVWDKDRYTDQPVKFINFAALNHHSTYCGITSSIKNYMGISDLSGGPDPSHNGKLTENYFNFHSFPFNKWTPGPEPGMMGAEMGEFMRTIRKADLNITTADWVGITSRTNPPVARTRAMLASTDPVALDYHAAKYILYPNSKIWFHHPDIENSPTRQYLSKCAERMGGIFDESQVRVKSYDFTTNQLQRNEELEIRGEITWGTHPKELLKYFLFRTRLA